MTDNKYSYPFAEERRIFYVAITRGKKKAYVLHDNNSESVFVRDLKVLM
jgi:DNA helicase-4